MSGLGPFNPNVELLVPVDIEDANGEGVSGVNAAAINQAVVEHRTGEGDVPIPTEITLVDTADADYQLVQVHATDAPGSYAVRLPAAGGASFNNDTDARQLRVVLHRAGEPRAMSEWLTIKDSAPFDKLVAALTAGTADRIAVDVTHQRGTQVALLQADGRVDASIGAHQAAALSALLEAAIAYQFPFSLAVVSATAGTVIFDNAASAVDDAYNGMLAWVIAGPGLGEHPMVEDYTGLTREAVLADDWIETPTTDSIIAMIRIP
jgi:hypothetical protein